jgi:hypothetical protein
MIHVRFYLFEASKKIANAEHHTKNFLLKDDPADRSPLLDGPDDNRKKGLACRVTSLRRQACCGAVRAYRPPF